ncbi:hypothetical protein GGR57DRAFT_509215 [Xylariaceae sp. FL1272]|nr:hypothetical protein GGR57DRAFT_509215 [Xylariaceae sp. FL1272]
MARPRTVRRDAVNRLKQIRPHDEGEAAWTTDTHEPCDWSDWNKAIFNEGDVKQSAVPKEEKVYQKEKVEKGLQDAQRPASQICIVVLVAIIVILVRIILMLLAGGK